MISEHRPVWRVALRRQCAWLAAMLALPAGPAAAATLAFTVTASESVVVTGTPRIAIDVGGVTRHATYAAGSGGTALTFSYAVQAGDFDGNGITLVSPIDLAGGSIADQVGNPANPLTFTLPDTSALKVQTYTAAFTTGTITAANASAVGFTIAKAPTGASFTYAITSSGGAGSVSGSGTISGAAHAVTGLDVSALPAGTLTLSVTVSTAAGGTGAARTATAATSFTGVLDALPASAAAFALRRLSGGYSGPLLRVRRASDNTEQTIPATIAGSLDTATLGTFCSGTSCFVSTLYDQSGNSRDAVQATTTAQPRLFAGGATETEGGKPALRFTAAGLSLVAPAITGQTIQATINAVARSTDTSISRHILGDRTAGGGRLIRAVAGGASFTVANVNAGALTVTGVTTQQRIVTMLSGPGSTISGVLDGVVTASGPSGFVGSGAPFAIGGQNSAGDWIGTISEAVFFNSSLSSANRLVLERNQGAHYGISVP
ncbi:arabinofuranosidase catalytic domain-containing protein [Aestuariivirga litoralis]|nr:arabinofuranosidase catalytic domain-containing protein [Aestuariivirga litoralis]